MNTKATTHLGTAKKVEALFLNNLNKPFTIGQVLKALKFDSTNSGVHHKIAAMKKQGRLIRSETKPFTYTAIPLHMLGNSIPPKQSKKNGSKNQALSLPKLQIPTPQGHANSEALFAARTTAPLDIPGMMQHIINVDEQNKVYRNALENIALILEQAGIIETTN